MLPLDSDNGAVLIDTESAAIVREIFERMADGELQGSIAQDLEKRGVTDWDGFYAFLKQLPNLKKVDMFNTVINLKVYNKLK